MQELGKLKDSVGVWRRLESEARTTLELVHLALEESDYSFQEHWAESPEQVCWIQSIKIMSP